MTTVLERTIPRQEANERMPRQPIDREALAVLRETRFQARKERIEADTHLDARLRDLFLDRTLVGTKGVMKLLDLYDESRVSILRSNRRIYGPSPHSGVLPDMDKPGAAGNDRPRPEIETGRLLEWAFDDHRLIWNSRLGVLQLNPHGRSGRRRKTLDERPRFTTKGVDSRRATRGKAKPRREQKAE